MFIVSNSSNTLSQGSLHFEGWASYENDDPLRAWGPAASRSALGPFLAYR